MAEGHCKGLGSYRRKDMAWLKIIVKDSSEDPRPAYLKRVQKMVDLLHSQKKKKKVAKTSAKSDDSNLTQLKFLIGKKE